MRSNMEQIQKHSLECMASSAWTHLSITNGVEIVGVLDVIYPKTSSDPSAYIQGIFVNEAYRRQGHARSMLRDALALCRHKGHTAAYLQVSRSNDAARALYESEGFFAMGFDAGTENLTYVINLAR